MIARKRRGGVRAWGRGALAAAFALAVLAAPTTVAAHVTRVVGNYTFLIILVGEPFFPDNRAGFEIWVKDHDRPIVGLERTLHTEAIGAGGDTALVIKAQADAGHYVAERDLTGAEFDPKGGGQYVLRLTGSVEQLPISETFTVLFPGYPRVAQAAAAAAGGQSVPASSDVAILGPGPIGSLMPAVGAGLAALGALAALGYRRRRRRSFPVEPVPAGDVLGRPRMGHE